MCSISMGINTRELSGACKSCDNCIHSDMLEDESMVCFVDIGFNVTYISPCHVCHKWQGKL